MRNLVVLLLAFILTNPALGQSPALVADFAPGIVATYPNQMAIFGGKLYMAASDAAYNSELRYFTGVGGLTLVADLTPGTIGSLPILPNQPMAVFGGKLYFPASDGGPAGLELYVYDGVQPPTLVADLYPNGGTASGSPSSLKAIGNRLYFTANSPSGGSELFVYTGSGTPVLKNINPGSASSLPRGYTELNGKVYFAATTAATGLELFVYDPWADTFGVAADIQPGPQGFNLGSIRAHGGKLYFCASTTAHGNELYSFDGTTATRLTDIATASPTGADAVLGIFNNCVLFSAKDDTSTTVGLYKHDLSTGTTSFIHAVTPGFGGLEYGNKFYFPGTTPTYGQELWMYDGTTTMLVGDIYAGSGNSWPSDLVLFNGSLYFNARDSAHSFELYRLTDASAGVIHPVSFLDEATIAPNPAGGIAELLLTLSSNTRLTVSLINCTGSIIWSSALKAFAPGHTRIALPTEKLVAGTYFYRVVDEKGAALATGRLVRE